MQTKIIKIPVESIRIGERRRIDVGDLTELQNSIKNRGLLHAIIITGKDNELVAGFRRLSCFKNLGLPEIDAKYYENLSPLERKLIELEENYPGLW